MSTYYLIGRLKAREPDMDFGERLREVMMGMSDAEYVAESDRCIDEFAKSSDELAALKIDPDDSKAQ